VPDPADDKQTPDAERSKLLSRVEAWLETPMLVLGFVWLALLIVEFTHGLTRTLELAGLVIWVIFILDFTLRFTLAPRKLAFLRSNWLTAISLVIPALRVFRVLRVVRALRLVRVVSSLNRGMRALGKTMSRRGFGYVVALTAVVTLVGAAGMYAFESNLPGGRGLGDYGTALWWTAMIMTTMGSEYWPHTPEGRVLCFLLALYAFGVFGYVTATLATFFIGRDAEDEEGELAGARAIEAIHAELAALRTDIRTLIQPHGDG
jgi:voltage-gated potassium channel